MSPATPERCQRATRPTAAIVMIVLTAAACVTALILREPLRSLYWARQVVRSDDPAQRAAYLAALCNAGDGGRWGTSRLLSNDEAEVRQLGLVVLQHVRSDWARAALLRALHDPDEDVRGLATLGLAMHGDDSVVPTLKEMYVHGDDAAAASACLALDRLGTPPAIAALAELSHVPAAVARRAALVDALDGIGQPACVPPLIALLTDHRPCDLPSRSARLAQSAVEQLLATGQLDGRAATADTQPGPQTIAERAAAALVRITGVDAPFASSMPEEQQQDAARRWGEWSAQHADAP